MANANLSRYNLSELKTLQRDIEKAIKTRQQEEVQQAREHILAIAKNAGFSVVELLTASSKKVMKESRPKAQPQYQNPADSSQTWAGRGCQPRWIAEAVAKEKALTISL